MYLHIYIYIYLYICCLVLITDFLSCAPSATSSTTHGTELSKAEPPPSDSPFSLRHNDLYLEGSTYSPQGGTTRE